MGEAKGRYKVKKIKTPSVTESMIQINPEDAVWIGEDIKVRFVKHMEKESVLLIVEAPKSRRIEIDRPLDIPF